MNRDARIAVVGSFAAGLTMKVTRFPSPGETVLGHGYRSDHGGKGSNQAVGCARLGAQVAFVARIGTDALGDLALDLYRQEGVDSTFVRRTEGCPTGVGFILVDAASGQNMIVLDAGANSLLSPADVANAESAISSAHVVLTQLEIPAATAEAALACGRRHGAITILNPAPAAPLAAEILSLADVVTPNEAEARVLLGYAPDTAIEPVELAQQIIERGPKHVVVTLGERGALVASGGDVTTVPAIAVQPVDTTGAGDAFNAALAVALAHGASIEEAVRFAVIPGGLATTAEGVIPSLPSRVRVARFFEGANLAMPTWLSHRVIG